MSEEDVKLYETLVEETPVNEGKYIYAAELKYREHGGEDVEYDTVEELLTTIQNLVDREITEVTVDSLNEAHVALEKKYQCTTETFVVTSTIRGLTYPEFKLWELLSKYDPEVLLA